MELLHMSKESLPMTLPLLPTAGVSGGTHKPAPLKASSLSRLEELQQYLRQCDDQNYLKSYIKYVSSLPRDMLAELTHKLKARSAFLCAEEQREYKRAKLLNVMGAPRGGEDSDAHAHAHGDSLVAGSAAADADAFCSQVLQGTGGEDGAAAATDPPAAAEAPVAQGVPDLHGMQLERLDMQLEHQLFMTPAEPARAKARPLPSGTQQPAATAIGDAAVAQPGQAGPCGDASPFEQAAVGVVTDHQISRISPDSQPAAAPAHQARASGSACSRVRQTSLLPSK